MLGSQFLAIIGIQVPGIKALARWGSDTVLDHIRDTPLSKLSEEYRKAITSHLGDRTSGALARSGVRSAVTYNSQNNTKHISSLNSGSKTSKVGTKVSGDRLSDPQIVIHGTPAEAKDGEHDESDARDGVA